LRRVEDGVELPGADLVVDQLFDGGTTTTMADDPLARLLSPTTETTAVQVASCTTPSAPATCFFATRSSGAMTRRDTPRCRQSFCVVGNDLRSVANDP
jgi:hypothetical protein